MSKIRPSLDGTKTRPSLDGASEAQILANRRNAQKSTSPRTLSMSLGSPGDLFMRAPSEADVSKLDNPAWPKSNQQARTELCA